MLSSRRTRLAQITRNSALPKTKSPVGVSSGNSESGLRIRDGDFGVVFGDGDGGGRVRF